MNPMKLFTVIGEVPVLDWKGPEFLGFYAACYVGTVAWSVWHRRKVLAGFSASDASGTPLSDPYELAFLAGGVPRCAQLAVVRLLERGDVEWKRPRWGKDSLVVKGAAHPEMNEVESVIHMAAVGRGAKGLPIHEIAAIAAPSLSGIESRLAIQGLRPTASERARGKIGIIIPFMALLMLGLLKLLIGLGRERPVIFLIICMVVVLFTFIGFVSSRKFLTPAGTTLLNDLRARNREVAEKDSEGLSRTVALMGVAGVIGYSHVLAMDEAMKKELGTMSYSQGSQSGSGCGGGGCSSGCGGDGGGGDGGGGCGGCGGD